MCLIKPSFAARRQLLQMKIDYCGRWIHNPIAALQGHICSPFPVLFETMCSYCLINASMWPNGSEVSLLIRDCPRQIIERRTADMFCLRSEDCFTLDASQQHLWHDVDYHKKINFTYFCGCFFFYKKVQFVVTARQYKPMEQRFHCKSRIVELMFVIKALMWKISVYYLTVKSSLWSGTMFILINWLHQYYTDVIRQVCSMWTVSFWYSWTKSPPLAMCVWRWKNWIKLYTGKMIRK